MPPNTHNDTWRWQQYHIKHQASRVSLLILCVCQHTCTLIHCKVRMIKLCPQDGLNEIMTFCYVQSDVPTDGSRLQCNESNCSRAGRVCHHGLILPKGAVLTLVKQMEGEQTCSCHSTAYFSLLYGWFFLPPDHQACSDLPQIGFGTVEPDICHIIFILPLDSTNGRGGGCHTVPYFWFVCADSSGFNCESFVLQQVAESTLHIPSLVLLAPFSGLFMSIFFARQQTIGLFCFVHKNISGSSVILTMGYSAAWLYLTSIKCVKWW